MSWTTRIITRAECKICKAYIDRLRKAGYDFQIMEESPENSKQLDEWKIEQVPVVQILVDGKLVPGGQMPSGTFSPLAIRKHAQRLGLRS